MAANPPKTRRPPAPIRRSELVELLRATGGRGILAMRARAWLVLLWRAGLRPQESVDVLPRDIDFVRGVIRVERGKGGKTRTVAIDPQALEILVAWRDRRAEWGRDKAWPKNAPFICTGRGKPVHVSHGRRMIKRFAEKANIDHRVHPHALRHSFAVELDREGASLAVIQQALGHAQAWTTSDYLRTLEPREVVERMLVRPPWLTASDEK